MNASADKPACLLSLLRLIKAGADLFLPWRPLSILRHQRLSAGDFSESPVMARFLSLFPLRPLRPLHC
jgi:hypothetical protein